VQNFQRLVDLLKRFRTEQPSSVAHGAPLANGVIDSLLSFASPGPEQEAIPHSA
jgi:hypothetical protein